MDDQAKAAFALIATNVAVITVADDEGVHGCTANVWAEATDPPLVLITLKRSSTTRTRILDAGRFAVNLLAEDQGELARSFARPGDRFAGLARRAGPELGQPLLPQSLASFECEVQGEHPFGAYDIVTGLVRSAETRPTARPLLFFDRGFRHLAEGKR